MIIDYGKIPNIMSMDLVSGGECGERNISSKRPYENSSGRWEKTITPYIFYQYVHRLNNIFDILFPRKFPAMTF